MRDIKNIDKLSDNNHKIDILSLNKFLLERGDNFLENIIRERYTFIKREDITKEFFQLNYKKIFHGESIDDLDFLGKDFPIDWYNVNIFKYILDTYFILFPVFKTIKLFPKEIFYNYNYCELFIKYNTVFLEYIPKDIENYYELVKQAFMKYDEIIYRKWFPKEYISKLRKDFPDNLTVKAYMQLKNLSENNNSLLKEDYRYVLTNSDVYLTKKIEAVSDKNKFDAIAFDKYLLSFGNNDLHEILFNKRYIITSKERFQKNYMNILRKNNTVKNHYGYDDEKYGYLSSLIPKEYYTKEMVDKIVEHFGLFTVVKKSLINQNVDGFANLVKEYITNRAYYSILANINPYIEGYYELFKFVIERSPSSIAYLNTEFDRYEELALLAVSIDTNTISNIPEYRRSYDVCLKAVSQNGFLIKRVPEDVENYYSLLKVAYLQNKDIIKETKLSIFYINRLKKDFPEDEELQKKKGFDDVFDDPYNFLQEYISKQVRKLLKESIYKKGNF
jgi:hypothetical protein